MTSANKETVFSNLIWRFLERFGAKGVEFIVSIVLARILLPEVYGVVALVTVFTTILNVFIDSGFGNALIQKKDADDLDFSTVFFFNFTVCLLLYALMFFLAPYIAAFYKMPDLTPIVRVLSLTLVISGVKNIQQAYVSRNLMFKKFFFSTLGGTVVAAIVGIYMAYHGYGVWALVAQQLVNASIDTSILWITVKWRPKRMFSFVRLKGLLSYGWKLLASSLLDNIYNQLQSLIIGKFYSSGDLAFYNQGQKYPQLLASNISTSIDSVLFPVLSQKQDDAGSVKQMTRRSIKTSIFVMAPIMLGMCGTSTQLISVVLTDKWLPVEPYLVVFCISFIFYPMQTANLSAIKAVGRSDLFLRLEIIKKIFAGLVLLITVWYGPFVMAVSNIFITVVSVFINSWPNIKLLNYTYTEQIKDILPTLVLAVIMMGTVKGIGVVSSMGNGISLLIQVISGVLIYIFGAKFSKNESLSYCAELFKGYLKRFIRK